MNIFLWCKWFRSNRMLKNFIYLFYHFLKIINMNKGKYWYWSKEKTNHHHEPWTNEQWTCLHRDTYCLYRMLCRCQRIIIIEKLFKITRIEHTNRILGLMEKWKENEKQEPKKKIRKRKFENIWLPFGLYVACWMYWEWTQRRF